MAGEREMSVSRSWNRAGNVPVRDHTQKSAVTQHSVLGRLRRLLEHHRPQVLHGAADLGGAVGTLCADKGDPFPVFDFLKRSEQFDPIDFAAAERNLARSSGDVSHGIARLNVPKVRMQRAHGGSCRGTG